MLKVLFLLFTGIFALPVAFDVDPATTSPFPHYWENCVGSCHALMGLRADWRTHMKMAHDDLGFKMVRFHGLLDDDMSVLLRINPDGSLEVSLYNVFSVFDYLLSIQMKPIVELGFMPELIASGNETIFHYKGNITPPKSFAQWNELIRKVMLGLIQRYGIEEIRTWPFEVWNEPNCGFFSGTQQDYFVLLEHTFRTIKAIDPKIKVGGPATCQTAWIPETIAYCKAHGFTLDFISTHEYPTDVMPVKRDIMRQVVVRARKEANGLPVYYTEFNDGLYWEPAYHDRPYAAAFVMQNVYDIQGLIDVFSWWTFTDLFEEGGLESDPFFKGDGWGLLNIYGIPKPSYRAYQLLHELGTRQVKVATASPHPTLGLFGTIAADGKSLQLILYNHNVVNGTIRTETAQITVRGLASRLRPNGMTVRFIDENHANAPKHWETVMGRPQYPTPDEIATLVKVSQLVSQPQAHAVEAGDVKFSITLLPESVAAITIPIA